MSHFKHHSLAILPLLTLLAMSPANIESRFGARLPASLEEVGVKVEVKEEFPKYKELTSKVDPESLLKKDKVDVGEFKLQVGTLKEKLVKAKEEFKKDHSDKELIDKQRKEIEDLVVEILLVELDLKQLKETDALLLDHKNLAEELLTELEKNETLLAQSSKEEVIKEEVAVEEEKKDEVKEELAVKEEEKKEEVKEEEKKEEVAVKEEDKKEEVKEEEKKEEVAQCKQDDHNDALSKIVEQLVSDQRQIMMAMLNMSQTMMAMMQKMQQQPNPFYSGNSMVNPYQFASPSSAGNWVYYPSGFQPGQTTIFNQGNIYPDQLGQASQPHSQQQQQLQPEMVQPPQAWGLSPQQFFQPDPRYSAMPLTPGNFGNEGFSFNMTPSPTPLMGQIPMAPMGQQG